MGRRRALALDAESLADVFAHVADGLQVLSPEFEYLYINPVAAAHGQRTPEQLIGQRMVEAYPGIDESEMFGHLQDVLRDGGEHRMENEFVFPSGERRWFELRIARVPAGVMILSIDITERKALDRRATQQERLAAVEQLAGGLAHELNNLLTVIRTHGELAKEELGPSHPAFLDVDRMLEGAERAGDLSRQLLAFAQSSPEPAERVDVETTVSRLGRLLTRSLGPKVKLTVELEPPVGAVDLVPGQLEQLVVNLAVNGRDAMPDGGELSIRCRAVTQDEPLEVARGAPLSPGDYVCIVVSDRGVGMDEATQERLFEPFFTTKEGRGGGLGLATCHGIVRRAGGAIRVYSKPGAGSCFEVYLPAAGAMRSLRAGAPTPPGPAPESACVMVVDDQPDVRRAVARLLRRAGYRVFEAADGEEALAKAEALGDALDLVLSDVVMPRMGGFELVERLRERAPAVRTLLMSGHAPEVVHREPDTVRIPMLTKPFTPAALRLAIRTALAGD